MNFLASPPILFSDDVSVVLAEYDPVAVDFELARSLGADGLSWLGNVFPKRAAEFLAGRACAWEALKKLGYGGIAPLESNADRGPWWPPGFCGSISHGSGLACAVVAKAQTHLSLGVDAEPPLRERALAAVWKATLSDGERAWISGSLAPREQLCALVFSAKEALYKCLRPRSGTFFGFDAAAVEPIVTLSSAGGALTLVLTQDLSTEFRAGQAFLGRYTFARGQILTAFELRL